MDWQLASLNPPMTTMLIGYYRTPQDKRDAARKAVEDPDYKAAMAKLSTPIHYLDAPEFQKFWDRDAKLLAEVMKVIGRVEEKK